MTWARIRKYVFIAGGIYICLLLFRMYNVNTAFNKLDDYAEVHNARVQERKNHIHSKIMDVKGELDAMHESFQASKADKALAEKHDIISKKRAMKNARVSKEALAQKYNKIADEIVNYQEQLDGVKIEKYGVPFEKMGAKLYWLNANNTGSYQFMNDSLNRCLVQLKNILSEDLTNAISHEEQLKEMKRRLGELILISNLNDKEISEIKAIKRAIKKLNYSDTVTNQELMLVRHLKYLENFEDNLVNNFWGLKKINEFYDYHHCYHAVKEIWSIKRFLKGVPKEFFFIEEVIEKMDRGYYDDELDEIEDNNLDANTLKQAKLSKQLDRVKLIKSDAERALNRVNTWYSNLQKQEDLLHKIIDNNTIYLKRRKQYKNHEDFKEWIADHQKKLSELQERMRPFPEGIKYWEDKVKSLGEEIIGLEKELAQLSKSESTNERGENV